MGALLLLGGCAGGGQSCQNGPVRVSWDFPGGAAAGCSVKHGVYRLRIAPETEPINPSPWYGFAVRSETEQLVPIELHYEAARHRYRPKRQGADGVWTPIPAEAVTLREEGRVARIAISAGPDAVRIAAQEPFPIVRHTAFLDRYNAHPETIRRTIGSSVKGRPIESLETLGTADRPSIVILGRQHPPEIPGAIALESFLYRILSDTALARTFRERFRIFAVPLMNPDGVAAGYWRMNAHHVDLNRDWGPFTQPETRAVRDALATHLGEEGGRVAVMLDFHATRRDVFYTQPDDAGLSPINFARTWLARLDRAVPDYTPTRSGKLDSGQPSAKTWFFRQQNSIAMTVEFGDETPYAVIRHVNDQAAIAFMQVLLGIATDEEGAS